MMEDQPDEQKPGWVSEIIDVADLDLRDLDDLPHTVLGHALRRVLTPGEGPATYSNFDRSMG